LIYASHPLEQLAEQKRSTAKITKLCLAAIRALEKLEDRPSRHSLDSANGTPEDAASTVRQEAEQSFNQTILLGFRKVNLLYQKSFVS
jgi:hypothetical protein